MSKFRVKVDTSELRKVISKLDKIERSNYIAKLLSKRLTEIAEDLKDTVENNFIPDDTKPKSIPVRRGFKFYLPERLSFPRKRTGNLASAIKVVRGKRTTIKGFQKYKKIYVSLFLQVDLKKARYGRILEKGGIIRPKKGRYLAIPTDKESFRKSPKEFSNLKLAKLKNKAILYKRIGNKKKALFLLKKSSEIKGFYYLKRSYKEYITSAKYKQRLQTIKQDIKNWLRRRRV